MNTRLYDVLGVRPSDDDKTIKKAYRKLARENHPDVNPDNPTAEQRFKEVSAAWEVLGDPERRKLYDTYGDVSTQAGFDAEAAKRARAGFGGGFPGGGFGGFGGVGPDIFEELLGGGRGPRKGQDLRAQLRTDFRTAALGGEHTLTFADGRRLRVRIPPGVEDGGTIRLRGKGGAGRQGGPSGDLLITLSVDPDTVFRRDGLDLHLDAPITVVEALQGASIRVPTLEGAVNVRVPPNSQSGQVLRVRGKGLARRNKPTGDLYVHLEVHAPPSSSGLEDILERLAEAYTNDVRGGLFQFATA
jgi:curved DNA-binding protein